MDLIQLLRVANCFDAHLDSAIAEHGTAIYAILFTIVFVEIGPFPLLFLPNDPLLFLCGAFFASGAISNWIAVPVLFAATVTGSLLSHWIGRVGGQRVFTRNFRRLDKMALLRTHAFYENHGGVTLLLSPFIAVVRTVAPFIGGGVGSLVASGVQRLIKSRAAS